MVSTRVCGTLSSGSNPDSHTAKTKNIPNYFVALESFFSRRTTLYVFLKNFLRFAYFGRFLFNRFGGYQQQAKRLLRGIRTKCRSTKYYKVKSGVPTFLYSILSAFPGVETLRLSLSRKTKEKVQSGDQISR